MKKVTGIGGIFFKCQDPEALRNWYRTHLGFEVTPYGASFAWRQEAEPTQPGSTQWSPFPADTTYFAPSSKDFMINYRVADLEALLAELRQAGVPVVGELQVFSYGKFAHILDPEGNKLELWEPADEA